MVFIQLDSNTAYNSLAPGLDDSEVAAQLLDAVDSLPHVVHRHFSGVLVRSDGLEKDETFLFFEKASVLFPERNADVYYLYLQI